MAIYNTPRMLCPRSIIFHKHYPIAATNYHNRAQMRMARCGVFFKFNLVEAIILYTKEGYAGYLLKLNISLITLLNQGGVLVRFSAILRGILVVAIFSLALLQVAQADNNSVEIVNFVEPSVVYIEVEYRNGSFASGSGFIVNERGDIVTNRHVLENAVRARATTSDGREYEITEIIGAHPTLDLMVGATALAKNPQKAQQSFLRLAPQPAEKGEKIYVFGNPQGHTFSVSDGIVAAYREGETNMQYTAPVSPGSSGGPIVNTDGNVVAVVWGGNVAEKTQNINYSVPANRIYEIVDKNGKFLYGKGSLDDSVRPAKLTGVDGLLWRITKSETISMIGTVDKSFELADRTDSQLLFKGLLPNGRAYLAAYHYFNDMLYEGEYFYPVEKSENYHDLYKVLQKNAESSFGKIDSEVKNNQSGFGEIAIWNFKTDGQVSNSVTLSVETVSFSVLPSYNQFVVVRFSNGEMKRTAGKMK